MTTILPSSNFERSAIHPLSNVTARDGYTPYFQPTTQKMVTHQDVGGGIYKRILSQEAAYKVRDAVTVLSPRMLGLTLLSHNAAWLGCCTCSKFHPKAWCD